MIDFNLMTSKNEEDLISSDYSSNSQIPAICEALEKIKDSYQLLSDRRKKQVSLGSKEREPRFVQDALANLYQHRRDSFDRFTESFQQQIHSMIDLNLVQTDKPKQMSMNGVLTLFESDVWKKFLRRRQ